jgi:hypothetical protein
VTVWLQQTALWHQPAAAAAGQQSDLEEEEEGGAAAANCLHKCHVIILALMPAYLPAFSILHHAALLCSPHITNLHAIHIYHAMCADHFDHVRDLYVL